MNELTNIVPKQGGWRARWTPEEDAVLLKAWEEWMTPVGRARQGFVAHVQTLFVHRSRHAILKRKVTLVRDGKAPTRWQRNVLTPLDITVGDCQYLAAMLDGEGSLSLWDYDRKRENGKPSYPITIPRVTLCYNTDEGILQHVEALVPYAKRHKASRPPADNRGVRTNKTVFAITVYGHKEMQHTLLTILPYMRHTEKIVKAHAILAFLGERIEARNA
jgi:hypothetical protein